jgi:hypothetical protein
MRKLLLFLFLLLPVFGHSQATAVITSSNIPDASGTAILSGKLCFTPGDASGNPLAIRTTGQMVIRPVCAQVVSGAIVGTFNLANTLTSTPRPFCYNVTLTDNTHSGAQLYPKAGYNCVQMASSWCTTVSGAMTCDWDNYVPASTAAAPVIAPSISIAGVTTGAAGTAANVTVAQSGQPTNYALTFNIPQGIQGFTNSLAVGTVTNGPLGASIAGAAPNQTLNLSLPILFNLRGTWVTATAYAVNDSVTNNGFSFVATLPSTSVEPPTNCTNSADWMCLVSPAFPAGMSQDGTNGIIQTGSEQVGTLYKLYKCAGADPIDGDAINAMLADGSGVYLSLLGACQDNTVVLNVQSNQTIDGGRSASITFSPSAVPSPVLSGMLTNVSAQEAATRTFSDGVTGTNSTQITSASGAAFVVGDVGQGITCQGVLGTVTEEGTTLPNFFSTVIRSRESATAILTVDPIPVAATGVSCSIFDRDKHIALRGLKIVNNGPPCSSGINGNWWITYFQHVSGLDLVDVDFQDGTTGQSTTAGCKSVLFSDVSDVRITNSSALTWNILQDGFDFFGSTNDVLFQGLHGHTGDDMIALQSSTGTFVTTFPNQGPQNNITINNSNVGSGTTIVKTLGPDQLGLMPQNNVTFSNTKCVQSATGSTSTTQNGLRGYQLDGGTIDNLIVDGMSGNCGAEVTLSGNIVHASFRNLSIDPQSYASGTSRFVIITPQSWLTNPTYGDIDIEGLRYNGSWTGGTTSAMISSSDSTANFSSLKIVDFKLANFFSAGTNAPLMSLNAASIGLLTMRDWVVNYVAGTGSTAAPAVSISPASGVTTPIALGQVDMSDSTITVTGGNGPVPFLQMTDVSTSPLISFKNVTFSGNGTGFLAAYGGGEGGNPTFSLVNDVITDIVGCFEHINGGNAFTTNYAGVYSLGNSFTTIGTPADCPPATQISAPTIVGQTNEVGAHASFDQIKLAGVGAPNPNNPTQVATGGAGGLLDNTTYTYQVCATNSVGSNCSGNKSVTICPAATCSNLSVATMTIAAAASNVQSYNVYRGTGSGNFLCSSLTNISPYVSSFTDTGGACTGAAVPTTNTSVPPIVQTNANGTTTTTVSPSAATSNIVVTQPSQAGTLAVTSQIPGVRSGSWSISSATSVAVTFSTAMTATPNSCQLTPSASSATTGTPFATGMSTTGFTVNVPTSGSLTGTYTCTINNAN